MDYTQAMELARNSMSGPSWATKPAKLVITLPDGTILRYEDVSLYGVCKVIGELGGPSNDKE